MRDKLAMECNLVQIKVDYGRNLKYIIYFYEKRMLIECAIFTAVKGKLNIQMSPSKKEHFALGIAHSLFF